jgi:hypothetical protein
MNLKIILLALASLTLLAPWAARAGECTTYCHTRNMCSTSCP